MNMVIETVSPTQTSHPRWPPRVSEKKKMDVLLQGLELPRMFLSINHVSTTSHDEPSIRDNVNKKKPLHDQCGCVGWV